MIEKLQRKMYLGFMEDLFEMGNGVTRKLTPLQKDEGNPVLRPEMPWEANYVGYPSVLQEPETGLWRMWYNTRHGIGYAESDDGHAWRRPELGRVEFDGSMANNLVRSREESGACCVIRDDQADGDQLYKMHLSLGEGGRDTGHMALFGSPDGIDWQLIKDPTIPICNDSQSTLVRDPESKRLLAFHRPSFIVRTITQSWSEDNGLTWFGHNHRMYPEDNESDLHIDHYAVAVFPYDGHLLGFMKVCWNDWYDKRCWIELILMDRWADKKGHKKWFRMSDRVPVVELGGAGAWDAFMMSPGHGLVAADGGHWFYYDCWNCLHTKTGTKQPHSRCCIGRAFLPFRRFFEWYADETPSFLRTKPVLVEGEALTVDCNAGETGLRACVMLADGTTPEGFTEEDSSVVSGDTPEGVISFKGGSLARFHGQPIHLEFKLERGAKLYAFGVM